jgi:hypothetical protein
MGEEVMGDGGADEVFVLGSDLGTTVVRQQSRYALARERLIEAAGGATKSSVPALGGFPAMPAVRK